MSDLLNRIALRRDGIKALLKNHTVTEAGCWEYHDELLSALCKSIWKDAESGEIVESNKSLDLMYDVRQYVRDRQQRAAPVSEPVVDARFEAALNELCAAAADRNPYSGETYTLLVQAHKQILRQHFNQSRQDQAGGA